MLAILLATLIVNATYIDLYHEGRTLLEQGQYKKAESLLVESSTINPAHLPTLKTLGEAYTRDGRYSDAIEQYRKALVINENDPDLRGRLAALYLRIGENGKAIDTYRDGLRHSPDHLGLKMGLAQALVWSHLYEDAVKLYKEVLWQGFNQTSPVNHMALKGLAQTYTLQGNLTDAINTIERAIELYPNEAELHKELGTLLAWQKHFGKALASLKRAVKIAPDYAEAYRSMGYVYTSMRRNREAEDAFTAAIRLEPDNVENYLLLAEVYMKLREKIMARDTLTAALKIDPSNTRTLTLFRTAKVSDTLFTINNIREVVELCIFVLTLVIVFIAYRRKQRILRRRHRLYTYFTNLVLPFMLALTLLSYFGSTYFSYWLDAKLIEDITEVLLFASLGISCFVLLWTERQSKEFNDTVVLAIGAHPDDIELGCSGLMIKAKDNGAPIYGLSFVKEESGQRPQKASKYMEMNDSWNYNFRDGELMESLPSIQSIIEEKIREIKATMVLTHTNIDIQNDHKAVFNATVEAAAHCSILCYEDVSTPREFKADYFVDISGYVDDKLNIINFHQSEESRHYMDPEVIKGRAAHRGLQCGVDYAEAFSIHKILR
ncbi:MAG: tetratricopeptide repeat protein [Thermodesulfobacteriota bacterium]